MLRDYWASDTIFSETFKTADVQFQKALTATCVTVFRLTTMFTLEYLLGPTTSLI